MMKNQLRETSERLINALLEGIERHKLLLISIFSAFYFAGFCLIASEKVMWNDELFTFYIARLPHFSDVWKALLTGAEQTPPFFYVLTRASLAAFGHNTVAIRLPEILGVFAACCCLYLVVARRSSVAAGAADRVAAGILPGVLGAARVAPLQNDLPALRIFHVVFGIRVIVRRWSGDRGALPWI